MNWNTISALFSPATLAAVRNVLSAVGILLGMVGISNFLTADQIAHIVAVVQQVGVVVGALLALIGLLTPVIAAVIAAVKSTEKAQIQRVNDIASTPTSPNAPDAASALQSLVTGAAAAITQNPQAIVSALSTADKQKVAQATVTLAANSETTKNALLDNVVELPSVQGVVVDRTTESATQSPLVTSSPLSIKAVR